VRSRPSDPRLIAVFTFDEVSDAVIEKYPERMASRVDGNLTWRVDPDGTTRVYQRTSA
jgi:hypothetical protein